MMKYLLRGVLILLAILLVAFIVMRSPDKSVDALSQIYANSESEWLNISGMDVHHRIEGAGHPLVLLHGTGASLHTWDGWTASLKDSLLIYRMDLPAFGMTGPHPEEDYSIDSYVEFVHQYVLTIGVDSFALAGNSLGGYIAWAYTLKYPDDVSHLILLDAAGYPSEEETTALAFKLATNPILSKLFKQITPKSFIRKNIEQVYADDSKITDALIDRYHDMALRKGNRQAFIDRVHTNHTDRSDQISNISVPTLIQWGAEDTWIDPGDADRFNKDISDSQLIIYDNVGHVPMEELPLQTAQDARSFIFSN